MSSATAIRERPILFSGPMVRAILEGRKTITRRVVKPQPVGGDTILRKGMDAGWIVGRMRDSENAWRELRCPYEVGMRLWVRERFTTDFLGSRSRIVYHADEPEANCRWRPSIHMSRWMSRLTLEVTGVRVERAHQITDADAIAEGVGPFANSLTIDCNTDSPRRVFAGLWDSINGPGSWALNPFVWCVSFTPTQERSHE